jgi:hypothetical protein
MSRRRVQTLPRASDDTVIPDPEQRHLLWARGYLYAREPSEPPHPWWRSHELGGRTLHFDPRLELSVARHGETFVAVLGIAVDLSEWLTGLGDIAEMLLDHRLRSRSAMIRALDRVCGRYIVIDGRGEHAWIQGDASCSRPVYYSTTADAYASHAHLLAAVTGSPRHPRFPDPNGLGKRTYAMPGNCTPWRDVRVLTPNTDLCLTTGEISRFFPRSRIEHRDPLLIIDHLGPLLERQLELLSREHRLLISLTAGLDSRTTLALSRSVADRVEYFCYEFPEVREGRSPEKQQDSEISRQLAERVGVTFHTIPMPYRYPEEPLLSVTRANATLFSHPALGLSHLTSGLDDRLHIRSSHFEVARRWFRRHGATQTPVDGKEMARLLTEYHGNEAPFVEEFDRFYALTDFESTEDLCDQHDLFYWEHRAGTWVPHFLAESDVAYENYTIVNARHIYEWLMSAPHRLRSNAAVQRGLITRYWPEAMEFPINGQMKEHFPAQVACAPDRASSRNWSMSGLAASLKQFLRGSSASRHFR